MKAEKKSATQWMAEWLCKHRRSSLCRLMGKASYLVWRAYENRNFDMHTNGEEWLLRQVSSLKDVQCLFDVGANVGDWLLMARQHFPRAKIHAFEIAPPVFSELQKAVSHTDGVALNAVGLSDGSGKITIYYREASHYCTTAYPEHLGQAYSLPGAQLSATTALEVPVVRGDDYVKEREIASIEILKIDVEGMEEHVLRGFETIFSQRRIRLVQFEYNTTNIVSKFLLKDAYDFFSRFGYKIGKLYPNHVEFRDYHYRQEDFCGPNMIAVHERDQELMGLLGGGRGGDLI